MASGAPARGEGGFSFHARSRRSSGAGSPRPGVDLDDRDIIARVLAGECECFHELVERHASPLLATLRARLGNREDAREVFQETWLRAFERLASVRDADRLRAWLLSIALNLVRSRQRRAPGVGGAAPSGRAREPGYEPEASDDPGSELEREEELEALRRSIALLPARQREVLDLRVNHELSHQDIGRLLGITEEASRASYYQALRRLRAELGPDDGDRR